MPKRTSKKRKDHDEEEDDVKKEEDEGDEAPEAPKPTQAAATPSKRPKRTNLSDGVAAPNLLEAEKLEQQARVSLLDSHKKLTLLATQHKSPVPEVVEEAIRSLDTFNNYGAIPLDPVRLAFIGNQGQGKSFICNWLLDPLADPKLGPFASMLHNGPVTSIAMTAKYGENKRISVILSDGSIDGSYDWDELTSSSRLPLQELLSRHGDNATEFLLEWPSLVLMELNLEITDLPGFNTESQEPLTKLTQFVEKEKALPTRARASLVILIPSGERGEILNQLNLFLPQLNQAGLFHEIAPSELTPFVFLKNNTRGFNDAGNLAATEEERFKKYIPELRKMIYNAFDVRDRDAPIDSTTQSDLNLTAVPPSLELKLLSAGPQIADEMAAHYLTHLFKVTEPLVQGGHVSLHSPFAVLVRHLRVRSRSHVLVHAIQLWLQKFMLPEKLAALALARMPADALFRLEKLLDFEVGTFDSFINQLSPNNCSKFWSSKMRAQFATIADRDAEPSGGQVVPLSDEACRHIVAKFIDHIKFMIEKQVLQEASEQCSLVLDNCLVHITKFASNGLGKKRNQDNNAVIVREMGDLFKQHIESLRNGNALDSSDWPEKTMVQLIDTELLKGAADANKIVRKCAEEIGVGQKTYSDPEEPVDPGALASLLVKLHQKLHETIKAMQIYPETNWLGQLANSLRRIGLKMAQKLVKFKEQAVSKKDFFEVSKRGFGAQPKSKVFTQMPAYQRFEKCKEIEKNVKDGAKFFLGGVSSGSKEIPALKSVQIEPARMAGSPSRLITVGETKPFHRLESKFFIATTESGTSNFIEATVDTPSRKILYNFPAKCVQWLKDLYNSTSARDRSQLPPIVFYSKLLSRDDSKKSIVFPEFHLSEIQATHCNTAVFVVVSSDELASYRTLLSEWLWSPDRPKNQVTVFLVSVAHPRYGNHGWLNEGRGWQIAKLLLEHLKLSERYAMIPDSLRRFRFWTNFRSWRHILPGGSIECSNAIMDFEQNTANPSLEFTNFVEELIFQGFELNKDVSEENKQKFSEIRKTAMRIGQEAWIDIVWRGEKCQRVNRARISEIGLSLRGLQQALFRCSEVGYRKLDECLRGRDRVAMIGLEKLANALAADGCGYRGKKSLEKAFSHRPTIGNVHAPLVNMFATIGIEFVDPEYFFEPPRSKEEIAKMLQTKGKGKAGVALLPNTSWEDVFHPIKVQAAREGFEATTKKFAADALVHGRFSFINTLLSFAYKAPDAFLDKSQNIDRFYFWNPEFSYLDNLRAKSGPASKPNVLPKRTIKVEGKEWRTESDSAVQQLTAALKSWGAHPENTRPDGNCQFHALCDQIYADLDPETGMADNHSFVRQKVVEWIEENLGTVRAGKTVADWIMWEHQMTPVEYLEQLRRDGSDIGGQVVFLAASFIWERPVFCFVNDSKQPICWDNAPDNLKPIVVGLVILPGAQSGHYYSVQFDNLPPEPASDEDTFADDSSQ